MAEQEQKHVPAGKRDKALSAAYLRLLGSSQEDAAASAGIGVRTLHRWEHSDDWPLIRAEAGERWLAGLVGKARRVLQNELDGPLALKVLERRLPELAPPAIQADLTSGGEPLPREVVFRFVDGDDDE